jgi:predicted metal-dependent hydrolase
MTFDDARWQPTISGRKFRAGRRNRQTKKEWPMQTIVEGAGRARQIAPRPMRFDFAASTPRYWMAGDPFTTHLMNALSLTFPEGERFFVASVRALREHVKEPELESQVRGFLAQESLHRREHEAFNEFLRGVGVPVDEFYREIEGLLSAPEQGGSKRHRLAITCALEHFTAILAEHLLSSSALQAEAHPNVRPLWQWHALEELDHKSVAFDVYRAAGGSYPLRVLAMLVASVFFLAKVSEMQVRLMKRDGELGNLRSWARGIWKFWGPRGHFSGLVPAYLRYFHPRFHPWEKDDSALIARFEHELASYRATRPDGDSSGRTDGTRDDLEKGAA